MKNKHDIIWLDSTDSTNQEALRQISRLDNLSVVSAERQTNGRGQRGNRWKSNDGENLLFSIVLKFSDNTSRGIFHELMPPLSAYDQFVLNEAAALAVVDFLAAHGISADIKWPNDIYVNGRKICGILIENSLRGNNVSSSIVGIGINVNQTEFDPDLPNPTSMTLCRPDSKHEPYNLKICLEEFMDIFKAYTERYLHINGGYLSLRRLYLAKLWKLETSARFLDFTSLPSGHLNGPLNTHADKSTYPEAREFNGMIRGLSDIGNLLVEDLDTGTTREYGFKEIGLIP